MKEIIHTTTQILLKIWITFIFFFLKLFLKEGEKGVKEII